MRTHRITQAAVAAVLLAGTVLVPPALAATPSGAPAASTGAVRAAAVPFTAATARRSADGGYTLSWSSAAGSVTVTAVTSPDATTGTPVGTAPGTGSLTVPAGTLAEAGRWYFRLVPDSGSPLVVAERSLGIDSARNFRDIGGYRTTDGRWVRPGLVYRSNKLNSLTDAEQQRLLSQHLTLDVDLRNAVERHDDPDRVPAGVTYQVADVVSLNHGIRFHDSALMTLAEAIAAGLFSGSSDLGQSIGYPFMVNFVGADYAFRDLVTAVATNDSGATVYHCSSGKDRTGWSTAVLLTLLGVPRETVEADFLASNDYLGNPKAVELSWLRAAFDEVDHLYGDFGTYVREGLRLDDATVAALRTKLLTG
ncbi:MULTISPECIES: tyrosine-protein phosphatase [unclassified Streptomyces]|uniref:tyrosine-protein phosphatase n=1 Tax=unclassified Streptomyces TaxID=2593676 RepID=UPI00081BA3F2|nr:MULTISPECIES: tyrosine-protein phosphatase [unclassified Streptomyces]MYQ83015.1 protein-tyrosine-phosphatase [Streptomyces sp. SID4936]SCD57410.1 protein-tyrosine phosphatase [Streptomyces sp. DvalAA-43]